MKNFIRIPLNLVDRLRSDINPLRGLSMPVVVNQLEEGARGAYADLQWTYNFIERRDATLRACKRRIHSALRSLDWEIKIPENLDAEGARLAQAQADALREAYDRIENLREAFEFLALAEFRGFSHLEKIWNGETITRLEPVPQWHWVRKGIYGRWQFNPESRGGTTDGQDIDPSNFLIREVSDPIDEIALVCYVRKGLSAKDWDGFVENFGIPYTFIIMPPQTSERERAAYEDTVRRIAADGRGVLPQGSEIKTADSGNRGTNPFREHLDYQDEQIVLAATGGLLTMLSQPTGIGSGASQAHADTFSQIARALALEVSEIFQAQLDADILKKLFPSQKPLAYFELCSGDTHDVKNIFENAVLARNAGYAVDPAQLQEKTGYKLLSNEK